MSTIFEVEDTRLIRGRGYVFARILEPKNFSLCGEHSLGGCPIESWIGQPRALTVDGHLRKDLFSFVLRDVEDLSRLTPGQRIELSAGACKPDC